MIQQFRRRPGSGTADAPAAAGVPVVRAAQWSGYNIAEVRELLGDAFGGIDLDEPNVVHLAPRNDAEARPAELLDWVLDGPDRPQTCPPDEFTATYEPVDAT